MTGRWFVLAFWGTFAMVFAILWASFGAGVVRSVRARLHPRAVAEFARANGWTYQENGWSGLRPGPVDWYETTTGCTHMVSGTSRGESFLAFEYAHQAQLVSLKLPKSLPGLEVRPQGITGRAPLAVPSARMESEDFDRAFWVHADDPKFASAVLTPRLMEKLLSAPPLCWHIAGDDLVGWWPGEPVPSRILLYLDVLHAVKDAIPGFVWADYGLTDTPTA